MMIPCKVCEGTGRLSPGLFLIFSCFSCGGTGMVEADDIEEFKRDYTFAEEIEAKYTALHNRIVKNKQKENSMLISCKKCKGEGIVRGVFPLLHECSACGGTGRVGTADVEESDVKLSPSQLLEGTKELVSRLTVSMDENAAKLRKELERADSLEAQTARANAAEAIVVELEATISQQVGRITHQIERIDELLTKLKNATQAEQEIIQEWRKAYARADQADIKIFELTTITENQAGRLKELEDKQSREHEELFETKFVSLAQKVLRLGWYMGEPGGVPETVLARIGDRIKLISAQHNKTTDNIQAEKIKELEDHIEALSEDLDVSDKHLKSETKCGTVLAHRIVHLRAACLKLFNSTEKNLEDLHRAIDDDMVLGLPK